MSEVHRSPETALCRRFHTALSLVTCLVLIAASTACSRPVTHRHVALKGRPETLEQITPTWVGEFAADVRGPSAKEVPDIGAGSPARPHVILISLDTLRADHLGAWGYERPTSPFLDALARNGVVFESVFSQSPKTAPSHMSLFSGLYPSHHGTHFEYETQPPTVFPVSDTITLLPEIIKRAGYRTAAWTGGGQVSRAAGFARGFDHFWDGLGAISPNAMKKVHAWFRRNSEQPCFLFIHTYQIHDPYLPPSPYNEVFTPDDYQGWVIGDKDRLRKIAGGTRYEILQSAFWRKTELDPDPTRVGPEDLRYLEALYDGGIRFTDDVLHGFFEVLLHDGLLENTLVVVFSDHGEEFLDHGDVLHKMLYQETLHVPLILFWPAQLAGGAVVESTVPLIDLGPTLLDLMGAETPARSEARTLLPLLEKPHDIRNRSVFSEEPWVHPHPHRSFRDGNMVAYDHGAGRVEYFSIDDDPLELHDLSSTHTELAVDIHRRFLEFMTARRLFEPTPLDSARELPAEDIEALRALGYIE